MDLQTLYSLYQKSRGINTDTRSIEPGMLFFALTGDRFDGHDYVGLALEKGALAAVVSRIIPGLRDQILVDDVLHTLQLLAHHHRMQFDIPVLGITGSNGKTTTKELIVRVLARNFRVHYTRGNLNNHIGVPLTLLAMPTDAEFAVIEMGTNNPGEIAMLSRIAAPNYGLITNIGKAHLEGLGSLEGVRKEKWSLFDQVSATGGVLFINEDDERLRDYPYQQMVRYGIAEHADYRYALSKSEPYISLSYLGNEAGIELESSLYGTYNAPNLMAAATVGAFFGVPWDAIREGIMQYRPANQRSQELEWHGHQVLLDAYNANPSSMRAAVEHFASRQQNPKVLILGDMLELGDASVAEHQIILELIRLHEWSKVFLVGPLFKALTSGYTAFESVKDMQREDWESLLQPASWILIKGSRGIGLEKLLV
mgnify:FL=1